MQTVKSVLGTLTSPPPPIAVEDEGYHLLIDRATGALIVTITGSLGSVSLSQPDADGAPATANPTLVAGVDGGGVVRTMSVLANGHLQVDIGNATIVGGNILVQLDAASDSVEVKQATHDNLNGNMTIQVGDVDVSGANPVPISAASLPLPTGAATESTLGDVKAGVGATGDAAVITDTTGSLSGKLRGLVKWAFERMPAALGQTTKSGSLPVAIASDQGALTVDTELAAAAALADGASNPTTAPVGACIKGYNGATWDRGRWPSKFIDMNAVSITSIATIWTPAGGKKFRLLGGTFSVSAAASVLFEDNGAGTTIFRTPKLAADSPYNFDLGPTGVLSAAANNLLKGTSSAAATITGTLYGTEE